MVITTGAASAQPSHHSGATGALPCPASASVAHLNVNGTAMVASLAASRSAIAAATLSLRSRRSAGQMKGHSVRMTASSEPPSPETSRFIASLERGWKSVMSRPGLTGREGQTVELS